MKYSDQSSIVKEKEREQWFRDEDYRVLRWLDKEIMFHPPRVMARIEAALNAELSVLPGPGPWPLHTSAEFPVFSEF